MKKRLTTLLNYSELLLAENHIDDVGVVLSAALLEYNKLLTLAPQWAAISSKGAVWNLSTTSIRFLLSSSSTTPLSSDRKKNQIKDRSSLLTLTQCFTLNFTVNSFTYVV